MSPERPKRTKRTKRTKRRVGRANLGKLLAGLEVKTTEYRDGQAFFTLKERVLRITPPFHLDHTAHYSGLESGPLLDALDDRLVAVFLVRRGGFAAGVLDGEHLAASKVGRRFVKGRHKKGGSSQARFQRRRQEQTNDLLEEAVETARRVFSPWLPRLEQLVLGGDERLLKDALNRLPELHELPRRRLPVGEPRLQALKGLSYAVYAAEVEEITHPA